MKPTKLARHVLGTAITLFVVMAVSACLPQAKSGTAVPVSPTATAAPSQTPMPTVTPTSVPVTATPAPTKPAAFLYPIPGDAGIRQAMAYCTQKTDLIRAVYPFIGEQEAKKLVVDSFVPKFHWAYAGDENITLYPYDPEKGKKILEAGGWLLPQGKQFREKQGLELSLKLSLGSDPLSKAWAEVWVRQMAGCEIDVQISALSSEPGNADPTELRQGNFEAAGWFDQGGIDPDSRSAYTCDQIPLQENDWQGQNITAWCNRKASDAITNAGTTVDKNTRKQLYSLAQAEFTDDLPALPLFSTLETYATTFGMREFTPLMGEGFDFRNINQWYIPGRQYATLGLVNEPVSLFPRQEDDPSSRLILGVLGLRPYTAEGFDFQPFLMKYLSTVDNGLAEENEVEVKEGQQVVDASGRIVDLKAGVRLKNSAGDLVTYTGGKLKVKQLVVRYEFRDDLKWQDGSPVSQPDLELGYKVACDPQSAAYDQDTCSKTQSVKFSKISYTVTWLPGFQSPLYFIPPYPFYPSNQPILSGGPYRGVTLAEVPPKDWASLEEVTRRPWSCGPYMIREWAKGKRMDLVANPNYFLEDPRLPNITILFIKPEDAVRMLLNNQVDMLGPDALPELPSQLAKAAENKLVKISWIASSSWEQIDFNLRNK